MMTIRFKKEGFEYRIRALESFCSHNSKEVIGAGVTTVCATYLFLLSDSSPKQTVSIYLLSLRILPLMSSDTTPATSTEAITPDSTNAPSTAARTLTGGCVCKSIRYKIARDQCQERMSMSLYSLYNSPTLTVDVTAVHVNKSLPRRLVSVLLSPMKPSNSKIQETTCECTKTRFQIPLWVIGSIFVRNVGVIYSMSQ
jgi:hypothetical protein